jgi:malate dehydrogenase (oxaloacetate-decarboxylating)(NADP+)
MGGDPMSDSEPGRPRGRFDRGVKLLHDPIRNKGTAFSEAERDALGLRGLLPPRVDSIEQQVMRVLGNVRRKENDLERYVALMALQDRNEHLFYRVVVENLAEMMPLIYTPTVGRACQEFGHIFRRPRGLWISARDRGRVRDILHNWPHEDVRVIVVTDGERILGLGDLGADGMGIPIGKLALYTACAGIPPTACLPVTLDVGTDNEPLRKDPLYLGLPQPRLRGAPYDALVEEFVTAVQEIFPRALLQLEDFATRQAFTLLARYRERLCCFDDDIQGTGAVALAGLYSALRITGGRLADRRYLLAGAGEAGIGIGAILVAALREEGLSEAESLARCWYVDSRGLVVTSRPDLEDHKRRFAREAEALPDLESAVREIRPGVLIGASGAPGLFSQAVLEEMAAHEKHPVVFALSNPTSKAECTARQAYEWTGGRAIFASGSPFAPVDLEGRTFVPGQGNNAYIFPGVGLGAMACELRAVTDEMFFAAARALADEVSEADLALGRVYPPLESIRRVSLRIAVAVAEVGYARGRAPLPRPDDLERHIREQMYEPI